MLLWWILRPKHLLEARARRERGEITTADLEKIEDAAIEQLVAKQESIGLETASDGEFRRTFWHFDFLEKLDGVERYEASQGIQFKGGQTKAWGFAADARPSAPTCIRARASSIRTWRALF